MAHFPQAIWRLLLFLFAGLLDLLGFELLKCQDCSADGCCDDDYDYEWEKPAWCGGWVIHLVLIV
jgi:hypothetical protein